VARVAVVFLAVSVSVRVHGRDHIPTGGILRPAPPAAATRSTTSA